MSTLAYPVIFQKTNDGYLVTVPDFDGMTQGTDLEDAVMMARDLISINLLMFEENGEPYPVPDAVKFEISQDATVGYVVIDMVEYMAEYRRKYGNRKSEMEQKSESGT